jgi:hypothetical protein
MVNGGLRAGCEQVGGLRMGSGEEERRIHHADESAN